MTGPALIEGLAGIVGPRHVRTAPAERLTYARDGLPTYSRLPGVVVLPGTRDEVVAVLRLLGSSSRAAVAFSRSTRRTAWPWSSPAS